MSAIEQLKDAPADAGAVETLEIPVEGMTCAACQAGIQRALRRAPGVRDANVHLMLKSATVTFDPAATTPEKLVDVIRDTGYEAEVPVRRPAQETAAAQAAEQDTLDRAHEREFRDLRLKAIVSGAIGIVAMIASMPLMEYAGLVAGAAAGASRRHRRSVHAVDDDDAVAVAARHHAVALRARSARARLHAAGADGVRDGLGRPSVLRPRVGQRAARLGGHEHARRARHRRGIPLLAARDARARTLHQPGPAAGRVLRGGDHHHRARPRRPHARSAREASDIGRAPRADETPAADRARPPRRPRNGSAHRRRPPRRHRDRQARRTHARRRRDDVRRERRRRIDAHGRVDAGDQAARRSRDGRHAQHHRRLLLHRHRHRRRQHARAHRPVDAQRADLAGAAAGAGRSRQRGVRAGRARHRDRHRDRLDRRRWRRCAGCAAWRRPWPC